MVLNDNEVMDVKAMKAIVGGQVSQNLCRNTGSGSGVGSSSNVVCSGECPTETVSGTTTKRKCGMNTQIMGGNSMTVCVCQ
ncbi:hypothetical protein [Bacteroides sp.]